MKKYNDDGQPHNYCFVLAEDEMCDSLAMVAITPVAYFNKEGCLSDWHINVPDPHLDQVMESSFTVEEWPDGVSDLESMHNYMLAQGYLFDSGFAAFLANCDPDNKLFIPAGSLATPAPVKAKKLSTDFFKNYIVTKLANDYYFSEVMDAYLDQPAEHASMRNPKNWKRLFKQQGTIASLAGIDQPNFTSFVGFALEEICSGYEIQEGQTYDQAYMSNTSNKIVVREFYWVGCHDQDTRISFITDETDTRIVAICYHID